ncbi:MAG TPA: response regulator [Caulobacteraceae bacterium]
MSAPTVLVIEDDVHLQRQIAVQLRRCGFEVRTANDGEDGLAQLLNSPADVVVTDIVMPRREGLETIVSIKKLRPGTRVIATSGSNPLLYLKLAGELGADAVLPKPFSLSRLACLVEREVTIKDMTR